MDQLGRYLNIEIDNDSLQYVKSALSTYYPDMSAEEEYDEEYYSVLDHYLYSNPWSGDLDGPAYDSLFELVIAMLKAREEARG